MGMYHQQCEPIDAIFLRRYWLIYDRLAELIRTFSWPANSKYKREKRKESTIRTKLVSVMRGMDTYATRLVCVSVTYHDLASHGSPPSQTALNILTSSDVVRSIMVRYPTSVGPSTAIAIFVHLCRVLHHRLPCYASPHSRMWAVVRESRVERER